MKHDSNNRKRRIARLGYFTRSELDGFAEIARYKGSPHHKSKPADYGFHPPFNPRPSKSLCDRTRIIPKDEANQLLMSGFALGMVSAFCQGNPSLPKFVWAVDGDGAVYEAKADGSNSGYHGYELYGNKNHRRIRRQVLKEWKRRSN